MARPSKKKEQAVPHFSDEELADAFREFLPKDAATSPLCLSQTALFHAIRKLLDFGRTPTSDKKNLSRASKEVSRITAAALELHTALRLADTHTVRLLLAEDTPDGRRRAMFVLDPHKEHPWLGALGIPWMESLKQLEEAGERTTTFLKSESTGGRGTLLTHLVGKRNYHFALQSRVLLAALGSPSEVRSSSQVCRMAATLVSLVADAVTDAGLRQYAEDSFDFIQSHPEEFREAHLRLLEGDLSARCSTDDPLLAQVRAQLPMGPTTAMRALIESLGT